MEQYHQIIPDNPEPMMTLVLNRKTGSIPKGTYGFAEYYCTDACDCRRVVIVVLNEKLKQKAVINFGFDQNSPFSGPYLDQSNRQSPYAEQLLQFFVDSLNSGPMWLDRLYRHYREVREKVAGKPYRGKPFPKPGELTYRVMPPPDLEAEMLESLKKIRAKGGLPQMPERPQRPALKEAAAPAAGKKAEEGIASLVERYLGAGVTGPIEKLLTLQKDLRDYLLRKDDAGAELAKLLPELSRQSPQDDERINAALRLLFDALNVLDEEMEAGRKEADERMTSLQGSLAQQVYGESEDLDLCAAVSNILVQSRVGILPVLRKATTKMMVQAGQRTDLHDVPGEEILSGLSRSLDSMGVTSPFEGAQEMLQFLTPNDAEMQTALVGEMLTAEKPLLRELAALLIFHPDPVVRFGVSRLLAENDGSHITPETLRRLIVSRNWLPEELRKNVDRTVTGARKARVECAPLTRPESMTVFASSIDGTGQQLFQVIVPTGDRFSRCSITIRQGSGVSEVSVASLKSKGEAGSYIALLKKEADFLESSPDYLDLRVCHALGDGERTRRVPPHWLVQVAELSGRDRWRGITFDPARELLQLWEELDARDRKLLDDKEAAFALEASGDWEVTGSFLSSWYESDEEVGREIRRSSKSKAIDPEAAIDALLGGADEKRRRRWLERIVVMALLLKSCHRPPVPWHQMFHVAQAVADETVPLREIPLMVKVASATVAAFLGSNTDTPDRKK